MSLQFWIPTVLDRETFNVTSEYAPQVGAEDHMNTTVTHLYNFTLEIMWLQCCQISAKGD